MCQVWWQKKIGDFILPNARTRENTRPCVCAFFCKMLKMAWNVCKVNLRRFGAFLFFARALTRGRTHARVFSDLKLTGWTLTLIMINTEWETPFRYEDMIMSLKVPKKNTKWRLDDVMKTWWPWKCYSNVSWQWPMTVSKLNEID